MAQKLADAVPGGYAFPQSREPSARGFIGLVACNDGFRAQSRHATPGADGIQTVSTRVQTRQGAAVQSMSLSKAIIEKCRRTAVGVCGHRKAGGDSRGTVRKRVQRMVDSGVMQIRSRHRSMQIGFAVKR